MDALSLGTRGCNLDPLEELRRSSLLGHDRHGSLERNLERERQLRKEYSWYAERAEREQRIEEELERRGLERAAEMRLAVGGRGTLGSSSLVSRGRGLGSALLGAEAAVREAALLDGIGEVMRGSGALDEAWNRRYLLPPPKKNLNLI